MKTLQIFSIIVLCLLAGCRAQKKENNPPARLASGGPEVVKVTQREVLSPLGQFKENVGAVEQALTNLIEKDQEMCRMQKQLDTLFIVRCSTGNSSCPTFIGVLVYVEPADPQEEFKNRIRLVRLTPNAAVEKFEKQVQKAKEMHLASEQILDRCLWEAGKFRSLFRELGTARLALRAFLKDAKLTAPPAAAALFQKLKAAKPMLDALVERTLSEAEVHDLQKEVQGLEKKYGPLKESVPRTLEQVTGLGLTQELKALLKGD